jgi:hypothetical protein
MPNRRHRELKLVLRRHPYLKAIGTTVFITLFFNAYFYLLKNPAYPITVMPFTWFDRLIGFQPLALPFYLSMWVYVSLPPALLATRRELVSLRGEHRCNLPRRTARLLFLADVSAGSQYRLDPAS